MYSIHFKVILFLFVWSAGSGVIFQAAGDTGREPVVWKISFEGNETYRSMVLHEIIASEKPNLFRKWFGKYDDYLLNETELRRDRIRILRYYQRRGFHNVQVDFEIVSRNKEWKKEVIFLIREGTPVMISSSEIIIDADENTLTEITESREFERASRRHEFLEGKRYELLRTADVEGRFIQVLQNLGHAWSEVRVETEIDTLQNRADVKIFLQPNQKTYFTNFRVEGGESVSERIILRETEIREGDLFNRGKLQEAQRQISSHHLFRFATVTLPEQPQDSTLNVLIRVREHPLRSLQASIGVGREEYLRGQVSWQHRNISGTGHRFGVSTRASFIEQRFSTDYLFPYVFNARSSYVTSLYGQHKLEPAFELFQAGFTNSLIYRINRSATASASYEFSINEEMSRDRNVSLPDSVINYNISSLTFSGYYSEGLTREPRGWVVQPFVELSGIFGEASFTFQKLSMDIRRYSQLSPSTTLAGRVNSGVIFYTQPDSLPSNIRYYSGGTNSVRGWGRQNLGPSRPSFDENGDFLTYVPVGGRAMFTFNLELRQQLTGLIPNFGIAAFLDGGQVWSAVDRIQERPVQFGIGGGLRYQSPIGPVRVDIGYKINPTDQDLKIFEGRNYGSSWDRIGIHFSIGQAF